MFTNRSARCRSTVVGGLLAMLVAVAPATRAQSLEWGATKYFKYNIENVVVSPTAGVAGSYDVKVIFSVTNPVTSSTWNIKTALPFQSPSASLTLDLGWDPATDVSNTGSENPALAAVVTTALGKGAALPVQARGLQSNGPTGATPCWGELDCPGAVSFENRYRITKSVTPVAFTSAVTRGRVALEGRPVCNGVDPAYVCPASTGPTFVNIPVTSAVANFTLSPATATTALIADPRRAVVDIRKCQVCHDGNMHGDTVVPQLSLHGGNRTGNLSLCVICHNPNQTDVPYRYLTTGTTADPRISGAETPIDFKTMVHSIHAGGFREKPFVVVGFGSSVNDFSHVRFPSTLRNCLNCHVEVNGRGTFELPLAKSVLGTTVNTRSTYLVAPGASRTINVAPADDLRISPTAAVCSSCHDKAEVRLHMTTRGGASFATTQSAIGTRVVERCAKCHGPGKDKDVRKAHEIDGSGGDD